jgi:hypothetical protein
MSDDIYCDVCGLSGRRRMFKHCPEGWFYGETPDRREEQAVIVVACSLNCKDRFFVQGPGNLNTSPGYIEEQKNKRGVE